MAEAKVKENKGFEQKEVEIRNKDYVLQKVPIRKAMELRQAMTDVNLADGLDDIKACDLVFEHIVVSPRVKLDDFTSIQEATELARECIMFLFGEETEKK